MSNLFIRDRFTVAPGHEAMGGVVSVSTSGITLLEDAPRFWRRIRVDLDSVVVPITAALDYGSVAILDLTDGLWFFAGSHANLSVTRDGTGIVAATDVNWALGSQPASAATLATTMLDVRNTEIFTADVLTDTVDAAAFDSVGVPTLGHITASSDSLYLNFAATLTVDGSMTVSGTIDLFAMNFERP